MVVLYMTICDAHVGFLVCRFLHQARLVTTFLLLLDVGNRVAALLLSKIASLKPLVHYATASKQVQHLMRVCGLPGGRFVPQRRLNMMEE